MTDTPLEGSATGSAGGDIITDILVDIIRIAPKKTYSMGGQDYSGMDYHGLLVRVRTEEGVEGIGEVFLTC